MAYAVIEDFRGGVDRRNPRSSGTPGTLWTGSNCHITRGGRIQKRLKLVAKYALTPGKTWGMKGAKSIKNVFGYEDSDAFSPPLPAGVIYQRLTHPGNAATPIEDLLDIITFGGKQYVIVKFTDGEIHHYYDGVRVSAWDDGVMTPWRNTNSAMATHLAALVNADQDVTATALANVITITGRNNTVNPDVTALAENGGPLNDQTATVVVTQERIEGGVSEVLATGSFEIDGGSGGQSITSITVNGVGLLGSNVNWSTSDAATAVAIANNITSTSSSPEYTAVAVGSKIVISAVAGSGSTPNGFIVTVSSSIPVTAITNMSGGVTASGSGQPKIVTVTIGGTAEVDDRFAVSIGTREYGAGNNPQAKSTFGVVLGAKLYLVAGSVVNFCAVNDPLLWRANVLGAGFFNVQATDRGSEDIESVAEFQGGLAFFATNYIQTWAINDDPAKNAFQRTISNSGAKAIHGVVNAGNIDSYYLSSSGIRSLRQQSVTGTPFANDIGDPIAELVVDAMSELTPTQVRAARAAINPFDARVWFWLGERVYVLSQYPQSKVSAWTWYDIGLEPGWLDTVGDRLYLRSEDTIYVYGGDNGKTYDEDANDQYNVDAELPFMHAGRIADQKTATAYNVGTEGRWHAWMKSDPNDPNVEDAIGTIDRFTYNDPEHPMAIASTHFAPRLQSVDPGPAMITTYSFDFKKS